MKGRTTLNRLYDRLTPKERFRLALDALARGDDDERERLTRSCPRKTYEMPDAGYTNRVDASREAAALFCILWLATRGDYEQSIAATMQCLHEVAGIASGFVSGANAAAKQEGQQVPFEIEGREPDSDEIQRIGLALAMYEFPESLEKHRRALAAQVKGVYEGLMRFCRDVDVEPKKLLSWCPAAEPDVESLRGLLDNAEVLPDEEVAERVRAGLRKCWWPEGPEVSA